MILHVGYPKSASTHLQENFFKDDNAFCYLNNKYPSSLYELIYDEDNSYTPEQGKLLAEKEVYKFLHKDKLNIISEERYTFNTVISIEEMAFRLHFLFPDAKVLIVLRNQYDILRSLYDMHPYSYFDSKRRWLTFDEWFSIHKTNFQRSFIRGLYYDKVISQYFDLFGRDKVCVVLLEHLIKKNNEAINKIADLLNISPITFEQYWDRDVKNASGMHWLYHIRLRYLPFIRLSKFIPKQMLKFIAMRFTSDRKTVLNDDQTDKINMLYVDSNRKLEDLINISLENEGYPV